MFDFQGENIVWEMSMAERITIIHLLEKINPKCSIEIGTKEGGSLQMISKYSKQIYSLDIDENVLNLKTLFPNVDFVIGDSKETLGKVLTEIKEKNLELNFVLIDGEHSKEGVQRDIDILLTFKPDYPMYVLMHDSFNPNCRRGILSANWHGNKYVHSVEMDFVHGTFSPSNKTKGEMWGGFAFATLLPTPREGNLVIKQSHGHIYETTLAISKHNNQLKGGFIQRFKNKLIKKIAY